MHISPLYRDNKPGIGEGIAQKLRILYRILICHATTWTMAKRVDLILAKKVALVRELEVLGTTQVSVAKKFGMSTSQVSHLQKKKEQLVRQYKGGVNASRKRQRGGTEDNVGKALFLWFQQKLSQGARLSRAVATNSNVVRPSATCAQVSHVADTQLHETYNNNTIIKFPNILNLDSLIATKLLATLCR